MKCLRKILPYYFEKTLFGDRRKHGIKFQSDDKDWLEWNQRNEELYLQTGRESIIHNTILNSGYKVLEKQKISGNLLEIGPGFIPHLSFWDYSKINNYTLLDSRKNNIEISSKILNKKKIINDSILGNTPESLADIKDNSLDCILAFNTLEHLLNIELYLIQFLRILKADGLLIGSIPTEGGLAWGTGRFFTTYQWFRKHTNIDFYKIICWEHVNFSEEIISLLNKKMKNVHEEYFPFRIPLIDLNLSYNFVFKKYITNDQ